MSNNTINKRLKRFPVKDHTTLTTTIELPSGKYSGSIIDISLNAIKFLTEDPSVDIDHELGVATLSAKDEIYDLGKIVVIRNEIRHEPIQIIGNENNLPKASIIVFKAITKHFPIEHLMRYLDGDGSSPYQFEVSHGRYTLADFYNYGGSDDILEKTRHFYDMHLSWKKKKSYQYELYRLPSAGKRVILDRPRQEGRKDYLAFGSNDYLGYSSHPDVLKAAHEALSSYGLGATGSPVSTGLTEEHRKLNETLKAMFQKESSLLFNSGYTANVGILSALCREGDLVLHDRLCHASIIDGLVFAKDNGSTVLPFKHNDVDNLENLLIAHRGSHKGCLIVTEGIFSMDGYIADLARIVPLAKKYKARIFLDCAHDFGVLGENGMGAAEFHDVLSEIDIIMGTFSKIAGSIGGFVVGSSETIEYFRMMSRAHLFSVGIPPCIAAGTNKALELFCRDKSTLYKLQSNIRYFAKGLRHLGLPIAANHLSTICPVIIGDEDKLEKMSAILFDHGLFPTPVVFPVVSRDRCRFRFTVTALHDQSDLDYALVIIKMALKEIAN